LDIAADKKVKRLLSGEAASTSGDDHEGTLSSGTEEDDEEYDEEFDDDGG